jgi:hypothetical protein
MKTVRMYCRGQRTREALTLFERRSGQVMVTQQA